MLKKVSEQKETHGGMCLEIMTVQKRVVRSMTLHEHSAGNRRKVYKVPVLF
jgi:hypothetical protein